MFPLQPFIARARTLAALVGSLLLGGCAASSYRVQVDAVGRLAPAGNRPAASFRIETRNPAIDETSLRHREVTAQIRTVLSSRGLYEAPASARPDMIVEVDYALGPPRAATETTRVPVFDRAGNRLPDDLTPAAEQDADAEDRGGPVGEDRIDLVGYSGTDRTIYVREKRLTIHGVENRAALAGAPAADLWRVEVCLEDESSDLRECLPILASAAMDHLGRTTDGAETVTVSAGDRAVAFVKRGME
jgi:hypothetical protein